MSCLHLEVFAWSVMLHNVKFFPDWISCKPAITANKGKEDERDKSCLNLCMNMKLTIYRQILSTDGVFLLPPT